ncbi:MAG: aspartate aminotransferase family protein [Spirochaetes bacterium]|nr:MAG: aspartate aminotransferase family protein [Spirochaetota bacterium]
MNNLSGVWTHATDIIVERGEGIYLYDSAGTKYMDFTSGIGVVNTGHCHPAVVEAIKTQSSSLVFGQLNIVTHKPVLKLVEKLQAITPKELDRFFFSNSGAEAVEAAVKLAKHATGRTNIIVFNGSFHGRTHLTMAMTTSKPLYRKKYQPLVSGIFVTPYPSSYYYGWDDEQTLSFTLRELRRLLASQSSPEETAAIIVEPVLGEGGYIIPPKGFLKSLRKICDEYGILLITDEIQSGFGRTGRFFAFEHEEIVPDIVTMAKGIASGLPLSGIAYKHELEEHWITGSHGGTYGGNPISCAAAVATVDVLTGENLVKNAEVRGRQLLEGLKNLQKKYSFIGDVRGLGLMAAVEFTENEEPSSDITKQVIRRAAEGKLLMLSCGTYSNIIRWIPPLIVTEAQIREGLDIFESALKSVK